MLITYVGGECSTTRGFRLGTRHVAVCVFRLGCNLLGILGRQTTEGVREWWSRLAAWLVIYGSV
jgi:hypothetical protein